jgi:hypothetical protein
VARQVKKEEPDMSMYASFDDLMAVPAADQYEQYALPSGKLVKIRPLTRAEHLWIGKGTEDADEIEARMISKALIEPTLTLDQAKKWQKAAASADVSAITDKIRDLSGFGQGADKRGLRAV